MADEKKPITQPSLPAQPQTKAFPKVVVPEGSLDAILQEVRAMRSETTDRLASIELTVDTLLDDRKQSNVRLAKFEMRLDSLEERGTKHSGGLTRISVSDETQALDIASLKAEVGEVKTEVAAVKANQQTAAIERAKTAALTVGISEALSGFWKRNPKLETAVVGFILAVLALGTLWVSTLMRGHS